MLPHLLAERQWLSPEGCRALIDLWDHSPAKREAERIVGQLVAGLGEGNHDRVVEIGCGDGRLITVLPDFRSYRGYDLSPYFIEVATQRFGEDKRCRFEVRDLFDPFPYRRAVDIVLCVHVARHYPDPLAVLERALKWPARYHVVSALHGPRYEDLLNCTVVSTDKLDAFLAKCGHKVLDMVEQQEKSNPELSVRYCALEKRS